MTEIQFGFIMPQVSADPARRATFVDDLNRALELVSGHFESARIIDHLGNNDGDIESFTTLAYFAALHPCQAEIKMSTNQELKKSTFQDSKSPSASFPNFLTFAR